MTHLLLEYDESVDAAYLQVSDQPWDRQERLDDSRGVNFAADGSVIGISPTMSSASCGRGGSGSSSEPPDSRSRGQRASRADRHRLRVDQTS